MGHGWASTRHDVDQPCFGWRWAAKRRRSLFLLEELMLQRYPNVQLVAAFKLRSTWLCMNRLQHGERDSRETFSRMTRLAKASVAKNQHISDNVRSSIELDRRRDSIVCGFVFSLIILVLSCGFLSFPKRTQSCQEANPSKLPQETKSQRRSSLDTEASTDRGTEGRASAFC